MPQFQVDEDLAALVERLAKPKPFENLSFNSALRRVLQGTSGIASKKPKDLDANELLAELMGTPKRAASPSAAAWAASVHELKAKHGLGNWRSICDALKIDTGGDSARRKLQNWVKANRPNWPPVPDAE